MLEQLYRRVRLGPSDRRPLTGHELYPPCVPSVLPDTQVRPTVLGRGLGEKPYKHLTQLEQREKGQALGLDC